MQICLCFVFEALIWIIINSNIKFEYVAPENMCPSKIKKQELEIEWHRAGLLMLPEGNSGVTAASLQYYNSELEKLQQ